MAFSINQMTDGSKLLADAVKAVQDKSSARRLLEDKVLADNGLGSKKQLFAENLARFEAIVDALVENKEVSTTIIFNADSMLIETAKDARFSQRHHQQIVVNEGNDLQELSKKTLGSYVKKASHDVATKGALTREFANRSREDWKKENFVGARKNNEISDMIFDKSWKRRKGMAKAVDKLTKEDIIEAILKKEGLHSIDQLTESGLVKLDAVVKQVMSKGE